MIPLKAEREIEVIRSGGRIVAEALALVGEQIRPGISTRQLDTAVEELIHSRGAVPAFKGYRGFPANICVSVNDEVVHGIPGERQLLPGDVVSIDIGVRKDGFYADAAWTFAVGGKVSREARRLIAVGRRALQNAIETVGPGVPLRRVSASIQETAKRYGFSVVRKFVGHGIGREMHEEPQVPNFVDEDYPAKNVILEPGVVLAIEPMLNCGTYEVYVEKNGWTVKTADGRLSAHFEHTIAVTKDGCRILTEP